MADHMYFFEPEVYSFPKPPIYINIVRNPLKRIVSWYYYIRTKSGYFGDNMQVSVLPPLKSIKSDFNDCVRNKLKECVFSPGN